MPRASLYDQQITIRAKNVQGQNSFGEDELGDPLVVCAVWAAVEYLQGRELDRVSQRWAEAKYRISMRDFPGIEIKREHWVEWNAQTLDILDVQGQGTRAREWTIIAKDHVA